MELLGALLGCGRTLEVSYANTEHIFIYFLKRYI
jgi:hypothetical protein